MLIDCEQYLLTWRCYIELNPIKAQGRVKSPYMSMHLSLNYRYILSELSVNISAMATFGKGVEYALHSLLYLRDTSSGEVRTVGDIAQFQGISATYLAKIFTKLKKAGLVRSSIGAQGGYELGRDADQISFWDVVVAVEGKLSLFECRNIRAGNALYRNKKEKPNWLASGPCEIHRVMMEVEDQLKAALQKKTLAWLSQEVRKKVSPREIARVTQWFLNGEGRN